ncbi:segregation and condensation protein a [hydrocarbon metagenome]|uniref:Segregation and condensation protein a n=1 Tax=hydrocarbon metagenome TaxID=938273 RepID=A0A0W8E6U5_9ZZZZ
MTYVVDLDAFHGPLDLLLYLIDRNEIDIYDIPIANITEQYLTYLHATGDFDLDKLGDFLSMASYLLNLKSRMLLPVNDEELEEDMVDPREELVKKLIEYRRYKKAAEYLMSRQTEDFARIFYRTADEAVTENVEIAADLKALVRAYSKVINSIPEESIEPFQIPEGDANVESMMEEILERLNLYPGGLDFHEFFAGAKRRREVMALFLALLELIRLGQVAAVQESSFSEIKVYLRAGDDIC